MLEKITSFYLVVTEKKTQIASYLRLYEIIIFILFY